MHAELHSSWEQINEAVSANESLWNGDPKSAVKILRYGDLGTKNNFYFIDIELCESNLAQYVHGEKTVDVLCEWSLADKSKILTSIMNHVLAGLSFLHGKGKVPGGLKP